ncbi:hypothetical protein BDV06DRAFT_111409 [Aspergillus oleicola]
MQDYPDHFSGSTPRSLVVGVPQTTSTEPALGMNLPRPSTSRQLEPLVLWDLPRCRCPGFKSVLSNLGMGANASNAFSS